MSQSIVFKFAGPTIALTVSTTASQQVTVGAPSGEVVNYAAFLNTGPTLAAVSVGNPAPAAVFPITTAPVTSGPVFMLPVSMPVPMVVAVPAVNNSFNFTAITNSSVPTTVFVTPVVST